MALVTLRHISDLGEAVLEAQVSLKAEDYWKVAELGREIVMAAEATGNRIANAEAAGIDLEALRWPLEFACAVAKARATQ